MTTMLLTTRVVLLSVCAISLLQSAVRPLAAAAAAADASSVSPSRSQCATGIDDFAHDRCVECLPGDRSSSPAANKCCDNALLRACFEELEAAGVDLDYLTPSEDDDSEDLSDSEEENKRSIKIMFGKRGRNTFLGKRADLELYKKARNTFLGKRSVDGQQLAGEGEVEKRARNTFLGKRARNTFLGKRDGVEEVEIDDEKRNRNKFLGKRNLDKKSRNVFLGKREEDEKRGRNTFLGKRESHVIVERSRNKFLGKRGGDEEQAEIDKRARNTFLGR